MSDLAEQFAKLNVSAESDTISSKSNKNEAKRSTRGRRSSSSAGAKKIILTVGRWQPPHNGHGLLIQEVISKSRENPEAMGLIYIPPSAVETIGVSNASARNNERFKSKIAKQAQKYRLAEMKVDSEKAVSDEMDLELNSNPLPTIKRWYYLNLMHGNKMMVEPVAETAEGASKQGAPLSLSKFLVGEPVSKGACAFHLCDSLITSDLKWIMKKLKEFDEMTASKRCVIARRAHVLQRKYKLFNARTETVKTLRNQSSELPSFKCIEYLKRKGVNDIEILVGSDRVEIFTRYNPKFAEKRGMVCAVKQAGLSRGARGSDSCRLSAINFSPKKKEKEYEALADVIDTCSTSNNSCSTLVDGQFSGTKIRECARTGNNLDYFAEGVKVPNSAMTNLDCYCLFYDLREAMGLEEFDIDTYNRGVSEQYKVTQEELIDNFYYHETADEIRQRIIIMEMEMEMKNQSGLRLTASGRRRLRELQNRKEAGEQLNYEDSRFLRDARMNDYKSKALKAKKAGDLENAKKYYKEFKILRAQLDYEDSSGSSNDSRASDSSSESKKTGKIKVEGGGRRTRRKNKRKRVPIKYVPKRLTRKDKKKARRELKKSRKAYKKGKYYTRKKVKSFKSKKSNHVINAMKIYGVKSVSASPKLAKKSGCSVTGLKKLVSKGAGAYYSSGSRPNQTAISWGRARMASAITGGKAAAVDFKILEKYCKPSSKALKLAKQAKKKHGYGTRKVRKVKL